MKKIGLIFLLVFFSFQIFAQRFDGIIVFGMAASQVDGDRQGGYNKINGTLGVNVSHKISKKSEFQTGINYIGKGARNGINEMYYLKTQLHYVQVPLQINFDVYKRFTGSFGIYLGYLISGKSTEAGTSYDEAKLALNIFEPSGYISLNYHVFDKIVFNFGFEYSLYPVRSESPYWFNNVATVTATYRISNATN